MNKYNAKKLAEKLERCRNVNLDDVELEDVDEMTDIKIDRRKPSNERILDFIMKVKNPYIFKVNGKLVRIRFSDTDKTAEDCLTRVLEIYIDNWRKIMKIRKLESNDMDQSYKLLNELYDNEIEYDIFENKYNNSLSDNNFYGIVAEENGIILGVLISRVVNRLVKSKDILFIDDLIVNKDCRSNGIGSLLLQNAINFAKEQNCETIELKSYISNKKSHRLYEKIGFKKLHYAFKKIIVKK